MVSKKSKNFTNLSDYLETKIQVLAQSVPLIIENKDIETAQLYQEIFIEVARKNIKNLVDSDSHDNLILNILL
jgi:hypothetical protein